jgi:hypothetical protein
MRVLAYAGSKLLTRSYEFIGPSIRSLIGQALPVKPSLPLYPRTMKLVPSISLIVAALSFEAVALPNTYAKPHSFFDKRGVPARFQVTTINGVQSTTVKNTNMTALYGEL